MTLILSLFPGLDLFGDAFEDAGFTVVRGPDTIWGGDIRRFHPPSGVFQGIIGGPPCQALSTAAVSGSRAPDLIPEFVRCWEEAGRSWVVMENVLGALRRSEIPSEWHTRKIRDWDCGGLTFRKRLFATWPFMLPVFPQRGGQPSPSVLASTAQQGSSLGHRGHVEVVLPGNLPIEEYARLQGVSMERLEPLRSWGASRALLCHLIGNGVPRALGDAVARSVAAAVGLNLAKPA